MPVIPFLTRMGLVIYTATGASQPYALTEIGRFTEGTDFPIPDFSSPFFLDLTAIIYPFFDGALKIGAFLWFQDVSLNNAYFCPLNQLLVSSGGFGLTNIGSKLVVWPADDFFFGGATIYHMGLVQINDVKNNNGTVRFGINS